VAVVVEAIMVEVVVLVVFAAAWLVKVQAAVLELNQCLP
jgi:hypothetical protein